MIAPRRTDTRIEQVRSLMPDWLAIELQYANRKHGFNRPQLTAFTENGLETQTGRAYGDIFSYLSRFAVLASQAGNEEQGLLEASRLLGKWVGTGRALVSASWQNAQALPITEADRRTEEEFEKEWYALRDFGEVPEADRLRDALEAKTEELVTGVRENISDPIAAGYEAMGLMVYQAKLFGAFTLEHGLMAKPGTDSKQEAAAPWDAFTVIN